MLDLCQTAVGGPRRLTRGKDMKHTIQVSSISWTGSTSSVALHYQPTTTRAATPPQYITATTLDVRPCSSCCQFFSLCPKRPMLTPAVTPSHAALCSCASIYGASSRRSQKRLARAGGKAKNKIKTKPPQSMPRQSKSPSTCRRRRRHVLGLLLCLGIDCGGLVLILFLALPPALANLFWLLLEEAP